MPGKQIKQFLENHHIKYNSVSHSPAFTSQEIAAAAHVSGREMAKTVIIKADGQLAMVVIPAKDHINFSKLREVTGAKEADLASESEFKDKFSECEVGAMPPFGNLYNMQVWISSQLAKRKNIVFNAGSHSELIQLNYGDFEELVKPKVVNL